MARRTNVAAHATNKPEQKKAPAPVVDGQYRAKVAFAHKLDRVERGSVVTLTAEQAAALGEMVEFLPPPAAPVERKEESDTESKESSTNDKEPGEASSGASASASTEPNAVEGATGEANQDQVV